MIAGRSGRHDCAKSNTFTISVVRTPCMERANCTKVHVVVNVDIFGKYILQLIQRGAQTVKNIS